MCGDRCYMGVLLVGVPSFCTKLPRPPPLEICAFCIHVGIIFLNFYQLSFSPKRSNCLTGNLSLKRSSVAHMLSLPYTFFLSLSLSLLHILSIAIAYFSTLTSVLNNKFAYKSSQKRLVTFWAIKKRHYSRC